MARPPKEGLEYFPLDVDIDQDDKVIIIIAKYGMTGFGVLIKLLMEIYKNGYSYKWTEKEQIIFSSRVSVDRNLVKEIVNDCLEWGLFNKEKFNQFSVLTSKGIQERYVLATSRRVNISINDDLRLVSVDRNPTSSGKMPVKSTQKKRKEIKVKETKINNNNNAVVAGEKAFDFYQQNFGTLSPFIAEDIGIWIDDLSSELVIEAMKIAKQNNKQWKYATGILKDWKNNNLKSLEDVEAHNGQFKRKGTMQGGKNSNAEFEKWKAESELPF